VRYLVESCIASRSARTALLIAALFWAPAQAATLDAVSTTLPNGLRLVVVENHTAPVVVHSVWYAAGAADDPPGKEGLAHLVEHLLLRADAQAASEGSEPQAVHNGTALMAATSYDYTYVSHIVSLDRLEGIMGKAAARMAGFAPAPNAVLGERSVIQEERLLRGGHRTRVVFEMAVAALFGTDHPYGRPQIGTEASIDRLTAADAAEFHRLWHAPNNAVVVVVGDVRAADVAAIADRTYGRVSARPIPVRRRGAPAAAAAPKTVVEHVAQGPGVSARCWSAPAFSVSPHHAVYAFLVFQEMLLATGAGIYYDPDSAGVAPLCFLTYTPIPKLDEFQERLLGPMLQHGMTEQAVLAAQDRMVMSAALDKDDMIAVAQFIGAGLSTGRDMTELGDWEERIRSVTAADVTEAVRNLVGQPWHVDAGLWPKGGS
jgi:zinc protease